MASSRRREIDSTSIPSIPESDRATATRSPVLLRLTPGSGARGASSVGVERYARMGAPWSELPQWGHREPTRRPVLGHPVSCVAPSRMRERSRPPAGDPWRRKTVTGAGGDDRGTFYSQFFLLKMAYSAPAKPSIMSSAIGYPYCQCSSGIESKFMP